MANGHDPRIAIRFQGVSKRFPINCENGRSLMQIWRRFLPGGRRKDFFWPLEDISFEIKRGQTVGIIGENGTGKSTILKLISRIIQPTSGMVEVYGRVSSLLELGAGFHPELTGRENIFLNGSILGLSRAQIAAVLPRIARFAGLGDFLDSPVKNYSSGMYARLGFAIAINVNPDILLIDEVLAVGDESFQRRCLDAIQNFRSRGKTVVIVSHNLNQLVDLCDAGIWLAGSSVRQIAPIKDVVRSYVSAVAEEDARDLMEENAPPPEREAPAVEPEPRGQPEESEPGARVGGPESQAAEAAEPAIPPSPPRRWGRGPIEIKRVQMYDARGEPAWSFEPLQPVSVEITYEAQAAVDDPVFSILIHKMDGHYLYATNTVDHPVPPIAAPGSGKICVQIDSLALTNGRYHLSAAAYPYTDPPYWNSPSDFHEWLYNFQVVSETVVHGDIAMLSAWRHEPPAERDEESALALPLAAAIAPVRPK